MTHIPVFKDEILREICNVLGHTSDGLSGSEIGQILSQCNIHDPSSGMTKRYRLYDALSQKQKQDRCGNNIILFIQSSMMPVRYIDDKKTFAYRKDTLNKVLSFAGLMLNDKG